MQRLCVFCGSTHGKDRRFREAAQELAHLLVEQEIGLVYGGGNVGLMGVIADAVLEGGGEVIGVIPQFLVDLEVAHRGLTELKVVATMHERKQAMHDLSDAFIALPGGLGTLEEIFEVITWGQLGVHQKPCAFLNIEGYYDQLLAFLDQSVAHGLIKPVHRSMILAETRPDTLLQQLRSYTPEQTGKWIHADQT